MSRPENLLSRFNSYNFHHILIACSNTQVAEQLAKTTSISAFIRSSGSVNTPEIKDLLVGGQLLGKYAILIHGAIDSNIVISNVEFESVFAPDFNTAGQSGFTTMSAEGTMRIEDRLGFQFSNILNNTMNGLNTDPTGICFLLKTIFLGDTDNDIPTVISNVRPLLFLMLDYKIASFGSTGSIIEIEFIGITNGAAKLPQANAIGDQISIITELKLSSAIEALKRKLNDIAKKNFEELTKNENINGRQVTYDIQLDDTYFDERYKLDSLPENLHKTKNKVTISFGPNQTIEQAINTLMTYSTAVKEDSERKNPENAKFMFKITSTINSSETKFEIVFRVNRYQIPETSLIERISKIDTLTLPQEGNYIELDYIFTGKNVDIKEFDMKLDMGFSFFQTLLTTSNIQTREQTLSGTPTGGLTRQSEGNSIATQQRRKSPIFISTKVKDFKTIHSKDPLSDNSFNSLLSRFAGLEGIDASVVIFGNPALLNDLLPLPSDVARGRNEKDINSIVSDWQKIPPLMKINIKMPLNDDLTLFTDFWYTGLYYIYGVKNKFNSEGEFTQEVQIMSVPVTNTDDIIATTKEKEKLQVKYSIEHQQVFEKLSEKIRDKIASNSGKIQTDADAAKGITFRNLGEKNLLNLANSMGISKKGNTPEEVAEWVLKLKKQLIGKGIPEKNLAFIDPAKPVTIQNANAIFAIAKTHKII